MCRLKLYEKIIDISTFPIYQPGINKESNTPTPDFIKNYIQLLFI
jgi:hypothetical protein